ncbi:MAG TPA: LysM peptidoglycan-binding domain-containing protein [Anaerolineales bacterium]
MICIVNAQQPIPTQSQPQFTPIDVINAVNNLRLSHGLARLVAHPVLMQIAQAEASGIATGYEGHWRPRNLTLGQWMLSLGYPLSGDLSLDGYRSENWLSAPISASANDVIQMWLGDVAHTDTMLSQYRSDIGAAVTVGEDGNVICVIETALQTISGKMQYDAYGILTGIPQTQVAYSAISTTAAKNGLLPQYSIPVKVSTAQPNGAVYHVVQYGQTLWSIAIAYHTTVRQIQTLNNLSSIVIIDGQKLLVLKGGTQPVAIANTTGTLAPSTVFTASSMQFQTPIHRQTPTPTKELPTQYSKADMLSFGAILIAALFLGGLFIAMSRKR